MGRVTQKTLDRIAREARALADSQGLSLERIEWIREAGAQVLRIIIQRPGGVGHRDCEQLHRPLSKALDHLDLIQEAYLLEVASPGTSAPSAPPSAGGAADMDEHGPAAPEGGTA